MVVESGGRNRRRDVLLKLRPRTGEHQKRGISTCGQSSFLGRPGISLALSAPAQLSENSCLKFRFAQDSYIPVDEQNVPPPGVLIRPLFDD